MRYQEDWEESDIIQIQYLRMSGPPTIKIPRSSHILGYQSIFKTSSLDILDSCFYIVSLRQGAKAQFL